MVHKWIASPASPDLLTHLLRFLQTLFLCLSRNGELLLNCDLFPSVLSFLRSAPVAALLASDDARVASWYTVVSTYLSFPRGDETPVPPGVLLPPLTNWDAASIPIACNCVRALFPRECVTNPLVSLVGKPASVRTPQQPSLW